MRYGGREKGAFVSRGSRSRTRVHSVRLARFAAITVLFVCLAVPGPAAFGRESVREDVQFFPSSLRVGVYQIFQAYLTVGDPPPGNPFDFQDRGVRAVFVHRDSGATSELDGYCDSADGWLFGVRFAPSLVGEYDFVVRYEDSEGFAEFEGTLEVTPSGLPGFLRVSEEHPYHFVWEKTGRYFFHQGHTAYHLANLAVPDENWKLYIDHIVERGFNKVRFLILSGRNSIFWHFLIFPFTDEPDTSTYDHYELGLWTHFDEVIEYMAERGVVASVIFLVEKENLVQHFAEYDFPTDKEMQYFRYAVARLAAYWNVTWDMGNEHNEYHSQNWARTMGPLIKEWDPYDHLLSVHGYHQFYYSNDPWADYLILQAYPGGGATQPNDNWYDLNAKVNWQRVYDKPVVDDEYGYEEPWPPDLIRKAHWGIVMAGGYATYGCWESLSVRFDEQDLVGDEIVPDQLVHMRSLFDEIDFWLFEPRPDRLLGFSGSWAWCLAKEPGEYLVYLPEGGSVSVDLTAAAGLDLPVEWMDPATGEILPGIPPTTGGAAVYDGDSPFGDDALLRIGRPVRDEPYAQAFGGENAADWRVDQGDWRVRQGAYIVRGDGFLDSSTLATRSYEDSWISFDLRIAEGSNGDWAGIHFRKETALDSVTKTGYLLTIYANGWVNLLQATGDSVVVVKSCGIVPSWQPGEWNRVSILTREAGVTVLVNDEVVVRRGMTRSYLAGYLSFVAFGQGAAFDNLVVEPVYFESFNDEVADGLLGFRGKWQVRGGCYQQKQLGIVAMSNVAGESYGDLTFRFRMRVLEAPEGVAAGVNVGGGLPTQGGGIEGYLFYVRPEAGTLGIARMFAEQHPPFGEVLAERAISETGIDPNGFNEYILQVQGNRIVVGTRDEFLLDCPVPGGGPIVGYVHLVSPFGVAEFDNLYLRHLDSGAR